ncbi:terminase family protein [Limimaricola variabilis]|uniref:DNA-packaging protein n=1 Tax=Limimaricola variabilis TaxID=1492771 RepID=UPI002AC90098|nr:terminase family protein [Limimaricola variabilis]WPY95068.1 terminase family protein [Limimaricola variabilis]
MAASPQARSTSTTPGGGSPAGWIACAPAAERTAFLDGLDPAALAALPHLFDLWALPHQRPPGGDWRTWVILGGRGAGKTRAGAEWVRGQVEGPRPRDPGRARRVALIGETLDQAREVMVFGDSGLMACAPPDRRPDWSATRRMLTWPNGATAQIFSAHDPEALRGPQFDAAWADELAKWKRGQVAWDMLQFGLRLGDPRACVTTTPRNVAVLRDLLAADSTVTTHAPTEANAANLAPGFLDEMRRRYAGTRQGRQELDGVLLADAEGALWTAAMLAGCVVEGAPDLDRIVVAVDPSVSAHAGSDACGIVVAGAVTHGPPADWRAYVLEDATAIRASPQGWARAACAAMARHGAERMVAEVNQGGALVETVVRQVDPLVPFKALHAGRSKGLRAEPVAALYEQGRVHHLRGLGALEDQMAQMTARGFLGSGSPDRVDALVWALHELMIAPAQHWRSPRLRML